MSQTSIIAGALIVAYMVFITVRGELPAYLAVFTGTGAAPPAGVAPPVGGGPYTDPSQVPLPPLLQPGGGSTQFLDPFANDPFGGNNNTTWFNPFPDPYAYFGSPPPFPGGSPGNPTPGPMFPPVMWPD
jgi:hypothetical protein